MSQVEIAYLLTLPTNSTYSEWSLIGSSCQHIHREYITNDQFLLILHMITLVSSIFNFTGFYCILTKSHESMGLFKWCLANMQFWIITTDIWVTILIAPRFIFPIVGGRTLGYFYSLGLTVPQLFYLGSASFGCMIASVFVLFLYRHQVILSSSSPVKLSIPALVVVTAFNYILYSCMGLPLVITAPLDQLAGKIELLKTEKCPAKDLLDPDVFVFLTSFTIYIPYGILLVFLIAVELCFMAIHSSWCLFFSTLFHNLSRKTRKMQAKFLLALFAQIAIPTALCYAPVLYASITILVDHYNQFANDICVFVFVTHGITSSICLLLFYDCYLDYLTFLFCRNRWMLKKRKISDASRSRKSIDITMVI